MNAQKFEKGSLLNSKTIQMAAIVPNMYRKIVHESKTFGRENVDTWVIHVFHFSSITVTPVQTYLYDYEAVT